MRYLKQLLDFYINSSMHVGLALFCLTYVTAVSNDLCRLITYPSCVFFGTIIGYNFLKYFEVFQKGNLSLKKYFWILAVTFLAALGYLFFVIRMVDSIKIQLLIAAAMVLVYPFLRKFGVVKMFWVSLVIAYLTAFVFIKGLPTFNGNLLLEFFKRFVLVSALMIPFEIYDSQLDDQTLNTLPQKFGVEKAKAIGYVLLLVFLILDFFSPNFRWNYFLIDVGIAIVLFFAILFSSLGRSQYYTSFWVESIPILWLALLLFFG